MNRLPSDNFGLKIYSRFPPKYIQDDERLKFPLRRYLEALGDGGFKHVIDDTNGILDLINSSVTKAKVLKYLYQQYGLNIFANIPEQYLRYLLPRLGEAWSKKGSIDVIEYVVSSLSGVKTSTEVTQDEAGNVQTTIRLEMDHSLGSYFPDLQQFERILDNFLPFYVGHSLIYSYVFEEKQKLFPKENVLDGVRETMIETAYTPSGVGSQYTPILSSSNSHRLNDDFILGMQQNINIDVDPFTDVVNLLYSDNAVMKSHISFEDTSRYVGTFNIDEQKVLHADEVDRKSLRVSDYEDTHFRQEEEVYLKDRIGLPVLHDSGGFNSVESHIEFRNILMTGVMNSVLNVSAMAIPDCADTITFSTGETRTVYPCVNVYN